MANKNKSQKNRRQRKNKTLRGGGMFDWLTGSSSTNTAPTAPTTSNKSLSYWFGISSAPKPATVVANPVAEPKPAEEPKPAVPVEETKPTEPKLGGKRKNKSNKNKNRKNKH